MSITFTKASRRKAFLKLAITGPTGAGKTYSAILLARGIAGKDGRIVFIDTENGSGDLYSHLTEYDSGQLEAPFDTKKYMDAIDAAAAAGYDVVVIDSFSHAWKAILAEKEAIDARGGNSFTNWAKLKPKTEALKNKIIAAPIHVICCMRSKMEHAIETEGGKNTVKKLGMGVVQESDIEYEFTTVFDLDLTHRFVATKDRTSLFDGRKGEMISVDTGREFLTWLDSGAEALPVAASTNGELSPKDWLNDILRGSDNKETVRNKDRWVEVSVPLGGSIEAAKLAMAEGVNDAADLFNWAKIKAELEAPKELTVEQELAAVDARHDGGRE